MILRLCILITLAFAVLAPYAYGAKYSLDKGDVVLGSIETYTALKNESLIEIARKFNLGFNEIAAANPDIDPFVTEEGAEVVIPWSFILPDVKVQEGIVINLSELRLYYFLKDKKNISVITYPIGIGQEGFDTPLGVFSIIEKKVKPDWHPPASIRKERPELPLVVPHGPENPLGSHALRLSSGTILIHGTHRPWGVGRKVSHGCIRLYPEDIPKLFDVVRNGTMVAIVRQPVKAGMKDNAVYVEVHDDYDKSIDYFNEAARVLREKDLLKYVNSEKLYEALNKRSGMPVKVSD